MRALVTGFSPFGNESVNPALLAIEKLPNRLGDIEIIKKEIPTVFGESIATMEELIAKEKPDFVIAFGQAGGRFSITPEVVAINLDEARIKDNEGNQPSGIKIRVDGKNAYFSTLPNKAIVKALNDNKIPAQLSYSAGTFVCNHLFYGLMHYLEQNHSKIRGGFVHVPFIREQVLDKENKPFMELETIIKAVELIIVATAEHEKDISLRAGAEH